MAYNSNIRTDLALEINENINKEDSRYKGVIVTEHIDEASKVKVTAIDIVNKHGENMLGKPKGRYVTIEARELGMADSEYMDKVSKILSSHIKEMIGKYIKKGGSILVAGLGNREVTADSLGPYVVDKLKINRHIELLNNEQESEGLSISSINPGVMAQTGIETAQIVKGVVKESKPVVVIAIDALAARDSKRLNSTIQLSDRGINPGSGVGNHRVGITEESIGVPVIAIGVPTVVDAPTIVYDALDTFVEVLGTIKVFAEVSDVMKSYSDEERYELARDVVSPDMAGMYVTPKEIDSDIDVISSVLAGAINDLLNVAG